MVPSLSLAQPDALNWIKSITATSDAIIYDLSFGFNEEASDFEIDFLGAHFCSDGIQDDPSDCLYSGICTEDGIPWEDVVAEQFCGSCSNPQYTSEANCYLNGGIWTPFAWENAGYEWYGDISAPPPPPPPSFDAALASNGERYYQQVFDGDGEMTYEEHVLDIQLQYSENDTIFITWDNTGWSYLGSFILQDAFGGSMINLDMTVEDNLILTNPAFTTLKLKVTAGEPNPVYVDYFSGWNLVGLPVEVENPDYEMIYPDAIDETLYSFDNGYSLENELFTGVGYWLRFPEEGFSVITGVPIYEVLVSLNEGWNLMSGISTTTSVNNIQDVYDIIIPGTIYGWELGYVQSEELEPGKGYWLRAFQDGEVTITGDGLARISSQDFSLNGKANTLTVNGMDLYFGVEMSAREKLSYSLPPKPPSGAFDIRFKGDTRVTKEKAEIEVMSTTETLTIAYNVVIDAGEHMNWVLTSDNGKDYILDDSGEITVPSSERFVLNRESVIPVTFALHQNYPNPFNPITTLRYDLPSDALVTLSIYDMLGREITQLVNTTQEAGFKSVQWDATDSMGRTVSAGVYLYQIQAGDPSPNSGHGFVQTKKMVLLK
jgi:hypothetical protein